jgi:hypothetical protein
MFKRGRIEGLGGAVGGQDLNPMPNLTPGSPSATATGSSPNSAHSTTTSLKELKASTRDGKDWLVLNRAPTGRFRSSRTGYARFCSRAPAKATFFAAMSETVRRSRRSGQRPQRPLEGVPAPARTHHLALHITVPVRKIN